MGIATATAVEIHGDAPVRGQTVGAGRVYLFGRTILHVLDAGSAEVGARAASTRDRDGASFRPDRTLWNAPVLRLDFRSRRALECLGVVVFNQRMHHRLEQRDAHAAVVAGRRLIVIVAGGYAFMHVFFFGLPSFDPTSVLGLAEIAYALSTLLLVGIGVRLMYRGRDAQRAVEG